MFQKKNIKKIKILGQDYLLRTSSGHDMEEIAIYVNNKMEEVIKSGIDLSSQHLKIAVFTCLEIAGELLVYKNKNKKIINEIEKKSNLILESIDDKLKKI